MSSKNDSFDPEDLKNHTEVINPNPELIAWFWQAVNVFNESERRKLLFFITGNTCAPQGGFGNLRPQFKIVCLRHESHNDLPRSHTCFNELDLPPCQSFDELFNKLKIVIMEVTESFEFTM